MLRCENKGGGITDFQMVVWRKHGSNPGAASHSLAGLLPMTHGARDRTVTERPKGFPYLP